MGRLLAIDYGKKRVGLAVTDPLQITANGLDTVASHEVLDYLTRYLAQEQVDLFLLGSPKQNDNSDSENMARVKEFAKALKRRFPDKEIVMVDERFTSVLAHRAMLDGGLKKKARQDKALVDKISATIILQSYMDSRDMMKTQ